MGSKTKDSDNIHLSCMAQSGELNCHVYCRISEQENVAFNIHFILDSYKFEFSRNYTKLELIAISTSI